MTETRGKRPGEGRREWLLVGLLLLLGLSLRLVFLAAWADTPLWLAAFGDEANFHATALSLLGKADPGDAFMYQPLYPLFLAGVYGLFGMDLSIVRDIQLVIGLGNILLFYLLGRELAGRWVGRLSALMAACYGPFIFYEGQLLAPAVITPMLAAAFWLLVRGVRRRQAWNLLPAGILFGACIMGRPNLMLMLPFAGLWWLLRVKDLKLKVIGALLAVAGLGLGVAPSWVHNAQRGMPFTPVSTSGGHSFYIGNNPQANGRFHVPRDERIDDSSHQAYWRSLRAVAEADRGEALDAGGVSDYWYSRGLAFWKEHPIDAVALLGKKALLAVNSEEMAIHHPYEVGAELVPVLGFLLRFGVVFAFAVLGVILGFRRRPQVGVLALCAGAVFLSLLVFYVADRYRISALPILIPLAALGMVELESLVRRGERLRVGAAFAGLAAVFALTQIPMMSQRSHELALSGTYNIMGKAEGDRGDLSRAEEYFRKALALAGERKGSTIRANLGLVAEKRGKLAEAEEWYRQAAERDPENRFALRKLVLLARQRGDMEQALVWLRQLERSEADPRPVRKAIEELESHLGAGTHGGH